MDTYEFIPKAPAVGEQGERRIEIFRHLLADAPKGTLLDLGAGPLVF